MMKKLALFLLFMSGLSYWQVTPNFVGVQIVGFGTNTSIHAAVAAATARSPGGTVFIPCGNYSDNLDITTQVSIIGENEGCVVIVPTNPFLPVIAIDAQHVVAIIGVVLRDFTLQCPLKTTCADGILIEGNGTNQPAQR